MTLLNELKLISARRTAQPAGLKRRERVLKQLREQIALAQAEQLGESYEAARSKWVRDPHNGQRIRTQVTKRVRPWWWREDGGRVCVAVRYGTRVVELGKGKGAVEVSPNQSLVEVLETLRRAVAAGELDAQLEAVSRQVRPVKAGEKP